MRTVQTLLATTIMAGAACSALAQGVSGLPMNADGGAQVHLLNPGAPDVRATAPFSVATLNSRLNIPLSAGQGTVAFEVSGLTASGAVLTPQFSNDGGTTWHPLSAITSALASLVSADGAFRVDGAGHTNVGLLVSAVGTGSVTVAYNASVASGIVAFAGPQPVTSSPPTQTYSQINVTIPPGSAANIATVIRGGLDMQATGPINFAPVTSGASATATSPALASGQPFHFGVPWDPSQVLSAYNPGASSVTVTGLAY